ncbi:uncharacterized protein [Excalfactoria chinensis]|uniref:uncharacterized protein n=1 Tax=Excalfactoria chinensis TaxID=46218 RepID=UPI003B3AD3CF
MGRLTFKRLPSEEASHLTGKRVTSAGAPVNGLLTACVLCRRADVDQNIVGRTFNQILFWVHEFCLMFANISFDETLSPAGTLGIDNAALTRKVKQANQQQCCVCGERGAAITCAESGCQRSFHLPCAKDRQCITQYFGQYRKPGWEENQAYTAVVRRNRSCDAVVCFYHGGRWQAEEEGPWQLIKCSSCRAENTHRECSHSCIRMNMWDCDRCAGLGTSASTISVLAALRAASQESLQPSHSPQEPEDSRTSPTSQVALGPSQSSQLPETSELGTERRVMFSAVPGLQDACEEGPAHHGSSHTTTPGTEGSSHTSTRRDTSTASRAATAAACRGRPRQRGTSRTRSRSPLQGRAPASQSPTRRPQGSRRTPAPAALSTARSTTRPATGRSFRASLPSDAAEWSRQPQEARMQSRSTAAHRATNVQSWLRRGCRRR